MHHASWITGATFFEIAVYTNGSIVEFDMLQKYNLFSTLRWNIVSLVEKKVKTDWKREFPLGYKNTDSPL